jgi:DNA-binding winged helix-turn-helix (wHTH) protein/Tol biopolymer transport system component
MIKFGEFTLDSEQARLSCQGKELAIEPKLFELLLLFVAQPNAIISRQDILKTLWTGSLVTDNAVNKLVANLRKVLADDPKSPRYIQTVPKRGYRLICEVTSLESLNSAEKDQLLADEAALLKENLPNKSNYKSITALLLLLCFLSLWQIFNDKHGNANPYTMELTRAHGAEESARMHPDNNHLYYLKKEFKNDSENKLNQLWIKNIHTEKTKQVNTTKINISKIIAVLSGTATGASSDTTHLFYLDKKQDSCGVYQATISHINHVSKINTTRQWKQVDKLFDCSDKRIKDIDYHISKNIIYYTAQPRNFWPNHLYVFNIETKQHSLVTQVEPVGWGHHSIDISPDGNKLLIMSTNSDYKTQLLVLNLLNNEITEGIKFNYPVTEAIWHHDSEQVYYYAAPPAHQIIRSDLNGNNATTVVSVSEYLSPQMTLFPDGKNLLFSTERKNFSNRWLLPPKHVTSIDNSTVDDSSPALFHHSSQYLFISKRSGRRQLYLGHYDVKQAEIVTNFSQSHWLGYITVSADDQNILLSADNKVYLLPKSTLNEMSPLTKLKKEHLIFTSNKPIISLDWLTKSGVAITSVNNGIPELTVVNLFGNKIQSFKGKWAYGLTDSQHTEYNYLIEQQSNALYRINSLTFSDGLAAKQPTFTKTKITLPNGFYHVKIDDDFLYYGSDEKDSAYLNAVPLSNIFNSSIDKTSKYLLNDFNGYDVSNTKVMLSDLASLEGDVHRTMH